VNYTYKIFYTDLKKGGQYEYQRIKRKSYKKI